MHARFIAAFSMIGLAALSAGCSSSDNDDGSSANGGGDAAGGDGSGADSSGTGGTAGEGSGGAGGETECPLVCDELECVSSVEPVEGIPHVLGAFVATDPEGSSCAEWRFEGDAICLSGTSAGSDPNACLAFSLIVGEGHHDVEPCQPEATGVFGGMVNPLSVNLAALGIERLQLTIDVEGGDISLPDSGISVGLNGFAEDDPASSADCTAYRPFYMMDGFNILTFDESGTVESALSDLIIAPWLDVPDLEIDPTQLTDIFFCVWGNVSDFDVCVRDIRFLDADGNEVLE